MRERKKMKSILQRLKRGMMILALRRLKCNAWLEPHIRLLRFPFNQAIHFIVENIYLKKKVQHPISNHFFFIFKLRKTTTTFIRSCLEEQIR